MNLNQNSEDEDFRQEVRGFIESQYWLGLGIRSRDPQDRTFVKSWRAILLEKKWLAPHWPLEWGGSNLSPMQRYILQEELSVTITPQMDGIALHLVGPVLYTFGSLQQKRRYLPKIITGEEAWCQGFSEPESGSDVLSARTTAERSGEYYLVNGQKIWTTGAHLADMMFALVRVKSAGRLQQGLTFMVFSMRDPNITVRPILTIDGQHHFNEVFLDRVRVPISNLIGEEGKGWEYARFLLANERAMVAQAPQIRQNLRRLRTLAAATTRNGTCLLERKDFQHKLCLLELEQNALELTVLRVLNAKPGDPMLDGLTAVLKIRGAALRQRVNELTLETAGERALIREPDGSFVDDIEQSSTSDRIAEVASRYLFSLSGSIAGGTSEIQRNLIAGLVLGMS
ncbi:acyl-CoA dehydrogenase family protein [Rhizobium leguminosarum]|uniref:acyl-CoA dehydrogenase family protein n=1 Tax=Rhizobium leguminosarum TaxID=384 RepID=UPI003F975987